MQGLGVNDVKADSMTPITAPMSYGIVQRIRGGVLIETYRMTGIFNADIGASMKIAADVDNQYQYTQRFLFQLDNNIQIQELKAEEKDLAVAVYFRTMSGQELRSKYVYLTDMGYETIAPSQVMEIDFDIGEVSEITGVNVVSFGNLNAPIQQAYLATQKSDGTITQEWSIQNGMTPRNVPARISFAAVVST